MKTFYLILLTLIFLNVKAQTLDQLRNSRLKLVQREALIKDSIKLIDTKIAEAEKEEIRAKSSFKTIQAICNTAMSLLYKDAQMISNSGTVSFRDKVYIIGLCNENVSLVYVDYAHKTGYMLLSDLELSNSDKLTIKVLQEPIIEAKKISDYKTFEEAKAKREAEYQRNIKIAKIKDSINNAELRKKIFDVYGKEIGTRILNHEIWIGMSKYAAELSIGSPKSINTTEGASFIDEQWVYETRFLYFSNGKLTTIQNQY